MKRELKTVPSSIYFRASSRTLHPLYVRLGELGERGGVVNVIGRLQLWGGLVKTNNY